MGRTFPAGWAFSRRGEEELITGHTKPDAFTSECTFRFYEAFSGRLSFPKKRRGRARTGHKSDTFTRILTRATI